jgi:hypothetical protein
MALSRAIQVFSLLYKHSYGLFKIYIFTAHIGSSKTFLIGHERAFRGHEIAFRGRESAFRGRESVLKSVRAHVKARRVLVEAVKVLV